MVGEGGAAGDGVVPGVEDLGELNADKSGLGESVFGSRRGCQNFWRSPLELRTGRRRTRRSDALPGTRRDARPPRAQARGRGPRRRAASCGSGSRPSPGGCPGTRRRAGGQARMARKASGRSSRTSGMTIEFTATATSRESPRGPSRSCIGRARKGHPARPCRGVARAASLGRRVIMPGAKSSATTSAEPARPAGAGAGPVPHPRSATAFEPGSGIAEEVESRSGFSTPRAERVEEQVIIAGRGAAPVAILAFEVGHGEDGQSSRVVDRWKAGSRARPLRPFCPRTGRPATGYCRPRRGSRARKRA